MKIVEVIFEILVSIMLTALPISWIWCLFHIVKCRGRQDCANRKCTYWEMCAHNKQARRADAAFRRAKLLEAENGMALPEEEKRE